MLVAQWIPSNGQPSGPLATGPAVALLWLGGALAVTAAAAALLLRREGEGLGRGITWLLGLGLSLAALGGVGLLVRHSEDQDARDGLHAAAERVLADALSSARDCATAGPEPTFVYPSGLLPGGETTFTPPPCSLSPRDALTSETLDSLGRYQAQTAPGFATNGEVTVTDPQNGRQLCVTVPDTADGSGSVADGPCGSSG